MTEGIEREKLSDFEALLTYLKLSRGFDFMGYKQTSLMRRIRKRMQMVDIKDFTEYIDYLEVHPKEFDALFNMILINVTGFFRDPTTWDYLISDVITPLLEKKPPYEQIRVWSAGCASGEEAYTVAMVMAESLGVEQFRERVKIYATDIDEDALSQARQGVYAAKEMVGVPEAFQIKYFDKADNRFTFRKDLRRSMIFGRHDLLQDAPISRIDLLICRNALMYFNAEAQAKILGRFHFALNGGGYLFLGKAEMLLTHTNLFTPLDLKRRIFTRVPMFTLRNRLPAVQPFDGNGNMSTSFTKFVRFREVSFEVNPLAQLVLDMNRSLVMFNERIRALFNLSAQDVGRSLYELELSYRLSELRGRVEDCYNERRPNNPKTMDWALTDADVRTLEVQVLPLLENNTGDMLGVSITFSDVTPFKRLREELEHANQELEASYEELQSSNEELETTNEELQSTIEEAETTNEELQSTNEELETMNEELQSANEELETMNEELHRRTEDLHRVNIFLESILPSLRVGVAVLNSEMTVQVWSRHAEDLWGLRLDEAEGKNFLSLDIGLPVEQLKQAIRNVLNKTATSQEVVLTATNRRGKSIECHVTCAPLMDTTNSIRGTIILMEDLAANSEPLQPV